MDGLLNPADAAKILGLVPASVRLLADTGQLPTVRTARGMRLFRREDVERLAAERAARQQAARTTRMFSGEQEPTDG